MFLGGSLKHSLGKPLISCTLPDPEIMNILIWSVETVITFVAPKEEEEDDGGTWKQGDVRTSIYNDVNGDYARKCSDPFDFAALAVFVSCANLRIFRRRS